MNKNLVNAMERTRYNSAKKSNSLVEEYELIKKMEPENIDKLNEKAKEAQKAYKRYSKADKNIKAYKEACEALSELELAVENADRASKKQAREDYQAGLEKFQEYERTLANRYKVDAEELEETEEYENGKKKGIAKRVLAGALAVGAAVGLGYSLRGCGADKQSADIAIVDEQSEEPEQEEENNENLTGKYGEFKDVTNEEQVNARANYLYNTYFEQFRNGLTATEQTMITPEKIANIIRVANGELPLDADGNKYFDANLTDDYIQALTKITADLPSSPALDKIYFVPTHLFAVDGSELSEFMKRYDEDYEKVAEARNNRDGEMAQEAIASLGRKLWYEWSLQGMNYEIDGKMTDYKSPFDLPAKERTLALNASVAKYGPYVFEYNLNAMQPVCIDACIDYYTKEMKQLTVNEIFVGVTSGEYDTVIAKAAGIEVDKEPDSIAFDQDLRDELEFKYKELKQMTLN